MIVTKLKKKTEKKRLKMKGIEEGLNNPLFILLNFGYEHQADCMELKYSIH